MRSTRFPLASILTLALAFTVALSGPSATAATPAVRTEEATSVSVTGATLNATVTRALGNGAMAYYGFEYSTDSALRNATSVIAGKSTHTGTYHLDLSELTPNTTYYYKAFIFKSGKSGGKILGTAAKKFTTLPSSPSATDDYSSYSNTPEAWWNVDPKSTIDKARLAAVGQFGGYGIDPQQPQKTIYLTFDCGYENGYTPQILDVLAANNIQATFFVTGHYLTTAKPLVERMVADGHLVGNHTARHNSPPEVSEETYIADVKDLQTELAAMGIENDLFRPPYGEYSERTMAITHDLGYRTFFWTFTYLDYEEDDQKGTTYAYDKVMGGLQDGAIILLHTISKDNANALDSIIKAAKAKGYTFGSLADID